MNGLGEPLASCSTTPRVARITCLPQSFSLAPPQDGQPGMGIQGTGPVLGLQLKQSGKQPSEAGTHLLILIVRMSEFKATMGPENNSSTYQQKGARVTAHPPNPNNCSLSSRARAWRVWLGPTQEKADSQEMREQSGENGKTQKPSLSPVTYTLSE